MVDSLPTETGERSDFLSTAMTAEKKFSEVLTLAESLNGGDRAKVFSFTSDLSLVDLSGFISAVKDHPANAGELSDVAGSLGDKDRSYLLYAAATAPGKISELTALTRNLEGQDLSNFLFTAANT